MELPVSTFPFQTFVDAGGEHGGATVMSHGLAEYEIVRTGPDSSPGHRDAVALTLIRAVGDLSREDLVTRPSGHAGPAVKTPGAQCLGPHRFRLAIAPRAVAPPAATLFAASRAFVPGPRIAPALNPRGDGSLRRSFIAVDTERGSAVLSALKKAEERDSVIVRLFNPDQEPARARLGIDPGIAEAFIVDMLERRQEPVPVENGRVTVDLGPAQIRTVELRIRN